MISLDLGLVGVSLLLTILSIRTNNFPLCGILFLAIFSNILLDEFLIATGYWYIPQFVPYYHLLCSLLLLTWAFIGAHVIIRLKKGAVILLLLANLIHLVNYGVYVLVDYFVFLEVIADNLYNYYPKMMLVIMTCYVILMIAGGAIGRYFADMGIFRDHLHDHDDLHIDDCSLENNRHSQQIG